MCMLYLDGPSWLASLSFHNCGIRLLPSLYDFNTICDYCWYSLFQFYSWLSAAVLLPNIAIETLVGLLHVSWIPFVTTAGIHYLLFVVSFKYIYFQLQACYCLLNFFPVVNPAIFYGLNNYTHCKQYWLALAILQAYWDLWGLSCELAIFICRSSYMILSL